MLPKRYNIASPIINRGNLSKPNSHRSPILIEEKSATLLQGKYLRDDEPIQILRPATVMNDLLATMLTVQNYVMAGAVAETKEKLVATTSEASFSTPAESARKTAITLAS